MSETDSSEVYRITLLPGTTARPRSSWSRSTTTQLSTCGAPDASWRVFFWNCTPRAAKTSRENHTSRAIRASHCHPSNHPTVTSQRSAQKTYWYKWSGRSAIHRRPMPASSPIGMVITFWNKCSATRIMLMNRLGNRSSRRSISSSLTRTPSFWNYWKDCSSSIHTSGCQPSRHSKARCLTGSENRFSKSKAPSESNKIFMTQRHSNTRMMPRHQALWPFATTKKSWKKKSRKFKKSLWLIKIAVDLLWNVPKY